MSDEGTTERTLAEKIDYLFRTVHPTKQGEYSYAEVAAAINQKGGPTISAAYIWQLRKGLRDNPTKKHLEALAEFFGVSPTYFFDDEIARRIEAELGLLIALRDNAVRQIALRASGMSPEFLESVADMIGRARKMAGLPEIDKPTTAPGPAPRSATENVPGGGPSSAASSSGPKDESESTSLEAGW